MTKSISLTKKPSFLNAFFFYLKEKKINQVKCWSLWSKRGMLEGFELLVSLSLYHLCMQKNRMNGRKTYLYYAVKIENRSMAIIAK